MKPAETAVTDHPAHEQATAAAIEFRDELLAKGWPDDHGVAGLTGKGAGPEATTCTTHARAMGALLGVWSVRLHGFVYPDFQFNHSGAIRQEVAELLAVLPGDNDGSGWRRAFWLYSPHTLLEGQTPAEVFPDAPARVIHIARVEFRSDPAATW